jgi:hypothetical protein
MKSIRRNQTEHIDIPKGFSIVRAPLGSFGTIRTQTQRCSRKDRIRAAR